MPISGILERLETNLHLLRDSEAKIARWILDHPEAVLHLTVRDLAREAKASQAAVIRLCHTLQIDGYSTLKVWLTADLVRLERRSSMSEYAELNPGASFPAQLQGFARATDDSIHGTLHHLDPHDLERVSQVLAGAERVLIFGVAASFVTTNDLAQKLIRLGYPVTWSHDTHMAAVSAALMGPHDVGIFISFSGTTREVLEIAQLARKRQAFVVAITQFRPKNPLSELADVVFHVAATEPMPRIGATTSVLASLLIGDALMLWLANRDATRILRYLKATEEAIRSHRL